MCRSHGWLIFTKRNLNKKGVQISIKEAKHRNMSDMKKSILGKVNQIKKQYLNMQTVNSLPKIKYKFDTYMIYDYADNYSVEFFLWNMGSLHMIVYSFCRALLSYDCRWNLEVTMQILFPRCSTGVHKLQGSVCQEVIIQIYDRSHEHVDSTCVHW